MVNTSGEYAIELSVYLLYYPEIVSKALYHRLWSQADLSSSAGSDYLLAWDLKHITFNFLTIQVLIPLHRVDIKQNNA